MLIEDSKKRQAELTEHLRHMATICMDDGQTREMLSRFKTLYSDHFRHSYFEFFPLIVDMAKDDGKYSLDYLTANLDAMRKLVETDYTAGTKEFEELHQPLTKLNDHINLEIGRYNYYFTNEQKVNDLEKRNNKLQEDLRSATQELMEAKKTVSSVQTELITVLSIFAAILLTFSGSLSLMGSAFSSIDKAPLFKTVFVLLICGIIFANTIFLLLYIVGKVTGRNIYAKCLSADCSCVKDNGKPKCWGLTRIRKRLPYIFWLNVLFLLLIAADACAWHYHACVPFFFGA